MFLHEYQLTKVAYKHTEGRKKARLHCDYISNFKIGKFYRRYDKNILAYYLL